MVAIFAEAPVSGFQRAAMQRRGALSLCPADRRILLADEVRALGPALKALLDWRRKHTARDPLGSGVIDAVGRLAAAGYMQRSSYFSQDESLPLSHR